MIPFNPHELAVIYLATFSSQQYECIIYNSNYDILLQATLQCMLNETEEGLR